MTDQTTVLADVRRGMIPAHIYNDREIFELEKERLFSRAWVFVGHESEIPQPGDYVVRRVLEDSFIVARDEEGEVRAHFNMCLHRGMQVCRAEMGNAVALPLPVPRLVLPQRRPLVGSAVPQGRLRRRGRLPAQGPAAAAGAQSRHLQRADLRQPGPGRAAAARTSWATSRSTSTTTRKQSRRAASSCADRSAGGSRRTGRSARRTSPATCTTRPQTHTSVVEIGLFREPKAEKRKDGATYWAGQRRRHHVQAARRRPATSGCATSATRDGDDRPDEGAVVARSSCGSSATTAS